MKIFILAIADRYSILLIFRFIFVFCASTVTCLTCKKHLIFPILPLQTIYFHTNVYITLHEIENHEGIGASSIVQIKAVMGPILALYYPKGSRSIRILLSWGLTLSQIHVMNLKFRNMNWSISSCTLCSTFIFSCTLYVVAAILYCHVVNTRVCCSCSFALFAYHVFSFCYVCKM